MDPFSYLSVLTSIVLALGITRLLSGAGKMLQDRSHVQTYWVHFLAQGPLYTLTILLLFALTVVAAKIRNERFHAFFAMFFLIYLLGFIAVNLRLLG